MIESKIPLIFCGSATVNNTQSACVHPCACTFLDVHVYVGEKEQSVRTHQKKWAWDAVHGAENVMLVARAGTEVMIVLYISLSLSYTPYSASSKKNILSRTNLVHWIQAQTTFIMRIQIIYAKKKKG